MKKIISMILCLMLVLSLATTAFATEVTPNHTITINNEVSGYQYVAYQIFKGNLVDGQLTNIAWGDNINSEGLIAELNKNDAFAGCETVVDVAAVLGEISEKDHETTMAFADIVSQFLTESTATSSYANNKYTINVGGDGYYLVKNTSVPAVGETTATGSYTRYILKVVGNVEVTHKGTVPEVTKKIVEGDKLVDANTADIGDTVNYKITGTLPSNIEDYNTYYYVFTDTMSEGLTYTNNVKVTVNDQDVTKYFYVNAATADDVTTLKVGIADLLALENVPSVGEITASTEVILTYTALVNEKANIGVDGETNEVKLSFSNDPNTDGNGTPDTPPEYPSDEPETDNPTGETPEDVVKTFTTEIKITKVDGLTQDPLTGAKFSISGYSSKVMIVNSEMYVAAAEGTTGEYYRLMDGSYTTEDPDEDTAAYYEDTTKTYNKIEVVSTETITTPFVAEGWVDASGVITFTGLGAGTYTITELEAPNGYNKLENPITVVITSNVADLIISDGSEQVTWTATVDDEEATVNAGKVEFKVENTSGSTLPETGGIGTTLFYVFGTIMVLGAAVLLITKKRMSIAE